MGLLNNELLIFEFEDAVEAKYVLEGGRRTFWGGRLNLERWNPDSGCVKRKNQLDRVWVRIAGLPLHLWICDVLRMIGDGCGGYLATDEEKMHWTEVLLWARILVKVEGMERPNTVNILSRSRSYELQIWWELPPWVVRVFPAKGEDCSKQNREEDMWGRRTFWGGRLNLERWNPDSGCVKRKNQLDRVWVRIVGLPLHLWTCDVLRMIGDGRGGYLATDEETMRRTEVLL